ncbi:MAG: MerR family transcriptional regulator [Candidatus Amulumruptor caecigallinarius]|nr:MerR family transcriptional regulator [Candidatus Amulumruptor caecigallinarius]
MATYTKQYYRLSEVSTMLNVPSSTINYWVYTFDELDPPTTKGGHRRYRPEDIELIKQIKVMMHDKGMQIEGAKRQLRHSQAPYRGFKCKSKDDALELLHTIEASVQDNPKTMAMVEAVRKWMETEIQTI